MANSFKSHSSFYQQALSLFKESGHAATDIPIYCNHSAAQTIYFDTEASISFSKDQRSLLGYSTNISHLFDIGDDVFSKRNGDRISFYSVELLLLKSFRSQAAYDIHKILQLAFDGVASVLLFKNDDKVMLSFAGFASDVILSDWYNIEKKFDYLVDVIHIANMSLVSARVYFFDFAYSAARWYYVEPISEESAAYTMLPLNYFLFTERSIDSFHVDREEIKGIIRAALSTAETEYGDDYVEPTSAPTSSIDIGAELDLLALDMEMDEDEHDLLDEQFSDDEYDDNLKDDKYDENRDEYEFDGIDPEIFKDPTLLVNWLKRNDV